MRTGWPQIGLAMLGLAALASCGAAAAGGDSKDAIVIDQRLPALDGGHLKVTAVDVRYGPGGSSAPHRHPCPVVGYIVEGAFRTQVKNGAEATYRAGESFYEEANGVHLVSANASDRDSVKLVAFFVCDTDQPLSTPESIP